MFDPLRTDTSHALGVASDAERDARIEQLLLQGLDHYFSAGYEQAVHIWTRVLFLERSHARARAYIDRARSALAERQRESDELLQNGVAAFQRGESDEARRLLQAAVHHGAPSEEALAVIDCLDRLEQGKAESVPSRTLQSSQPRVQPRIRRHSTEGRWGVVHWIAVGLVVGAGSFFVTSSRETSWWSRLSFQSAAPLQSVVLAPAEADLPIPRRGETALTRARALAASGHLHDSLAVLDQVRPTDPQKAEADRLQADIQRQLIGLVSGTALVPIEASTDDLRVR